MIGRDVVCLGGKEERIQEGMQEDKQEGKSIPVRRTSSDASLPRILLISASTGNGHMSAARALEKTMLERNMEVLMIDALDYSPKGFRTWYRGGYEMLVRRGPQLWGYLYRTSDRTNLTYRFQTALDVTFTARLDALLRSHRPDWVVCTHSLPQPRLARARARMHNFRIAVVVTDFYPHSMWCRGNPDHYFVPGDWTRDLLEARAPGSYRKTSVTGIPVDPVFIGKEGKCAARRHLGLREDLPTIMLSSGGIGGGPLAEVAGVLAQLPVECQVVAVCGRNKIAYEHLAETIASLPANSKVTFRQEAHLPQNVIAMLMQASDFQIGKPGGLTLSESLVSGCPLFVYRPLMIPGQEEGNADLLEHISAGNCAVTPEELGRKVTALLQDPERVEAMRQRALEFGKPNASADIVRLLCEL